MRLIEIYSKRSGEYKARFQSKRRMPPRYKVLEWRPKMQANIVRGLVKLSSKFDEVGQGEISGELVRCAERALNDMLTDKDIERVSKKMEAAGFPSNDPIFQEAGMFDGLGGAMKGLGKQIGNFTHQLFDPAETARMLGKSKAFLNESNKNITALMGTLTQFQNYTKGSPAMSAEIGKMLESIKGLKTETDAAVTTMNGIEANINKASEMGYQQPQQAAQPSANPQTTPTSPSIDITKMTPQDRAALKKQLIDQEALDAQNAPTTMAPTQASPTTPKGSQKRSVPQVKKSPAATTP